MTSTAKDVETYLAEMTAEKQETVRKIREVILENLPNGFEETMSYEMIGYVVPHSLFPQGYHCDPKLPLPFINLAAQKNNISLYHMGIYAKTELMEWYIKHYEGSTKYKLNMGKGCIRFRNEKAINFELIAQLVQKMRVDEWIATYERSRNN